MCWRTFQRYGGLCLLCFSWPPEGFQRFPGVLFSLSSLCFLVQFPPAPSVLIYERLSDTCTSRIQDNGPEYVRTTAAFTGIHAMHRGKPAGQCLGSSEAPPCLFSHHVMSVHASVSLDLSK